MKLFAINAGTFKLDGGSMFGVVPKTLWQRKYPADENNLCTWALRCLLVDDGKRKILMDAGIGDTHGEKFMRHYQPGGEETLQSSLARHGYSCDDVTDVVLSHLHFDHCGGAVRHNAEKSGYVATFKNARYWASAHQWENAIRPNLREKASIREETFLPLADTGRLELVKRDTLITDGVSLRLLYGHTAGMIVTSVAYRGSTIVFVSDLFPAAAHIPPPYVMAFDNYPLRTLEEKEAFLDEACAGDYILFFGHDLYNECGRVGRRDRGVAVTETLTLRDAVSRM